MQIEEQISMEQLKTGNPEDLELLREIVQIMTDIMTLSGKSIRISGGMRDIQTVQQRFKELEKEHDEYVLKRFKSYGKEI